MEFTLDELLAKIRFMESVVDRVIRVVEDEEETDQTENTS